MGRKKQLTAYAQLLMAAIGFCAAVYLLVTGEKPPPAQQVLKEYS